MPPMNSIVANVDTGVWGVEAGKFFFPNAQPFQGNNQIFGGQQYAVTAGAQDSNRVAYVGMLLGSDAVYGEANTSSNWNSLGYGPVSRLISGKQVFAAGCVGPSPACVYF